MRRGRITLIRCPEGTGCGGMGAKVLRYEVPRGTVCLPVHASEGVVSPQWER